MGHRGYRLVMSVHALETTEGKPLVDHVEVGIG